MPKTLAQTKHFQLAGALRRQLKGLAVGDAIPTVDELKARHGVSQATVERALQRLQREGLIERPAGRLRPVVAEAADPAVHRVVIVRPDYASPTYDQLSRCIVAEGRRRDWAFEQVSYRTLGGLDLRRALQHQDGGILLPTSEPFPDRLLASLQRPRRPVLVIQEPPEGASLPTVRMDDQEIGRLAVEHLAGLGHRRILLVQSEPTSPSNRARAEGWRRAMADLGQADLDGLTVRCETHPFESSMKCAYRHLTRWLDGPHPPFDAVFCAAWTGAMAALRALREHGRRIPEDVSVVSHGGEDDIASFLNPPLTSVETDLQEYGRKVVDAVAGLLSVDAAGGPPTLQTVSSRLVPRGTTAPASTRRG